MKKLIIILLCACLANAATGQAVDSVMPKSPKPHMGIVNQMDKRKLKGWLFRTSEDSVHLLSPDIRLLKASAYLQPLRYKEPMAIAANNIKTISLKKKNAGTRGALIGLGSGALIGMIGGLASGDDKVQPYTGTFNDLFIGIGNAFAMTAGEKAAAGALAGGILGAGVGALLSPVVKKKFTIGGDTKQFHDLHDELMKRSYIQLDKQQLPLQQIP